MKQEPIEKSKTRNPWPRQKRRAAQLAIIWELKTYKAMKADIEAIEREVDEEAAPSATDIRESIYLESKQINHQGGFNTSIVIGHPSRSTGDPTISKAEAIRRYRESIYDGTEYREMIRRINAIERVLERLERSNVADNRNRAKLIREKYFEQEKTDERIAQELSISRATFFRWQAKTIREIAKELGFIT